MSAELSVVVDDLVGALGGMMGLTVLSLLLEEPPEPVVFLLVLANLALKFLTRRVMSSRLQDVSTLSSISVSK